MSSNTDVAIIGAGAAGIGAARRLRELGVPFVLLEASHRIGGRGYTEDLGDGVPFDLGCHWLHSGSLNPFAKIADSLGFSYAKDNFSRTVHFGDRWASKEENADFVQFFDRNLSQAYAAGEDSSDLSIAEVTERENRWTALFDYIMSLYYAHDSDQVAALDVHRYRDTNENWPLRDGYGALIARFGADLPVSLNAPVQHLDWSGKTMRLDTPKGTVEARRAIVTVSTGILGAGDIRFVPDLPDWKQAAIAALPLGNHNRICLLFDGNVFGPDHPRGAMLVDGKSEPMGIGIRPFGYDYVVGYTGGRFADWLERAGIEASADLVKEHLVKIFGSAITKRIVRHNVTAWRGDPWVRGAYSALQPGHGDQRAKLAETIDERLYFAGEATSPDFFSTAHGAYLSGIAAADALASSSKAETGPAQRTSA